jgi:hypothetical protein
MCLIQSGTSRAGVNNTSIAPVGITGDELPLKGEHFIDLTPGGKVFRHGFGVCVLPTKADGILGTDFLSTHRARLDLANLKLEVGNLPQTDHCSVSSGDSAFTIFPARIRQADRNSSLLWLQVRQTSKGPGSEICTDVAYTFFPGGEGQDGHSAQQEAKTKWKREPSAEEKPAPYVADLSDRQ